MNEEKNIEEAPEENNDKVSKTLYTNDHIQTKTMEVYHHPDVGSDSHRKKNFKEYFLEFIMIFLAVTMGFFTECAKQSCILVPIGIYL